MQKYSLEAFLDACGAHGHLLLDVRRGGRGDDFRRALHQPFALIGGVSAADLVLKDPGVSRRHGYLQVVAGRAYYVELSSLAGADSKARPLGCKQSLRLGTHQVRLLRGPAPGSAAIPDDLDPLATGSASRLGIPSLVLEVMNGDAVRLRWRMNRLVVLLGSAPGCRVRLGAGTCSPVQCSLVSTPRGTWVVDLLGRGGIQLNGVQARVACVEDGDILQLGGYTVRLRYDDAGLLEAGPSAQAGGALPLDEAALVPAPRAAGGRQALACPPVPEEHALGAFVLPLLGQFNQMQLQMSEQFQQAAMQMFQMFGTLHRDQTDLLREEFDRQHRLTQELRQLQEELTKLQVTAASARNGPTESVAPVRPAAPTAAPARAGTIGMGTSPAASGAPAVTAGAAKPGDRPATNGQDVHAWLCRRMEALQQERQTGWQKILGFLASKR